MIRVNKVNSSEYRFELSPNCSISWRELLLFYLMTCCVALAVGLFFTLQGLWFVLPFSGLEMLALGAALYLTSRRVHRREVIILDPERTRIEKGQRRIDKSVADHPGSFSEGGADHFFDQLVTAGLK